MGKVQLREKKIGFNGLFANELHNYSSEILAGWITSRNIVVYNY